MVSYGNNYRPLQQTPRVGCGCGGVKTPVSIPTSTVPTVTPTLHVASLHSPSYKSGIRLEYNKNQPDLSKPSKVTQKEKSIALTQPSKSQPETHSSFNPISRGISRENSYNKMNLPRKGCCGKTL